MRRPYAVCHYVCGSLAIVTAATPALSTTIIANTSSANLGMRRQVVSSTGILDVSDYTGQVTRGDFAKMLVNASSHRENLPTSSISVSAGVSSTHLDVIYIRITASQGWMTGFLGGPFKPEEYIIYKDAVKVVLTMLGYSGEDFTGDLVSSRVSKFDYPELDEEVNRQPEGVLSQTDRMSISCNLLKAKKKDSSEIRGVVLDCELNSDGKINPTTILDDKRRGPVPVCKGFNITQSVPPGSRNANVFLSGTASTPEAVEAPQQDAGFVVAYYNVKSRTIWAYATRGWDDDDLEDSDAHVLLKGEVKNIYYKSTNVMTPTSIRLEIDDDSSDGDFGEDGIDEDGYLTINLSSPELRYLFPICGGIEIEDGVVAVCSRSSSSYMAIDATEY